MHKWVVILFLLITIPNMVTAQYWLNETDSLHFYNEIHLNSPALEFSPTFFQNGEIAFISDKHIAGKTGLQDERIKKNTMSIYVAKSQVNHQLVEPKPFALELTTEWHEGPLSFNQSGNQVFFSRNSELNGYSLKTFIL